MQASKNEFLVNILKRQKNHTLKKWVWDALGHLGCNWHPSAVSELEFMVMCGREASQPDSGTALPTHWARSPRRAVCSACWLHYVVSPSSNFVTAVWLSSFSQMIKMRVHKQKLVMWRGARTGTQARVPEAVFHLYPPSSSSRLISPWASCILGLTHCSLCAHSGQWE